LFFGGWHVGVNFACGVENRTSDGRHFHYAYNCSSPNDELYDLDSGGFGGRWGDWFPVFSENPVLEESGDSRSAIRCVRPLTAVETGSSCRGSGQAAEYDDNTTRGKRASRCICCKKINL
jgi:hypothetical protein